MAGGARVMMSVQFATQRLERGGRQPFSDGSAGRARRLAKAEPGSIGGGWRRLLPRRDEPAASAIPSQEF
jgi:hypothetical protein